MMRCLPALTAIFLALAPAHAGQTDDPFAAEIAAFEQVDGTLSPVPGTVVFTGSSSIRFWTTIASDMAPLPVLNRGFGGSRITDANRHFDRLVARHRPAAIVLYSGDNDLLTRLPETVLADLDAFMILKDRALGPQLPVFVMTVKPSPARLELLPVQQRFNRLVLERAGTRSDLRIIDVATPMLDANGQPRGDLFGPDGLHLNQAGYTLWRGIVRTALGLTAEPAPQ